jgi:phosphoserine aminotransferase|tara:strand:- start:10652 stop:11617 length:966 start_codon:yes stop_codon:yes gene_type:complete
MGIVPASDTGAFEMGMWSLLGARSVDILVWESFSSDWANDIVNELRLPDCRVLKADYGYLPELNKVDFERDVVFAWNGTTSGARVPNADWIPNDREGLTLCDATSAVFAQDIAWKKLDFVTFSWQKVLGGEAGFGMVILGPKAIARLEKYTPERPIPKIFRLSKNGKVNEKLFQGETINTPSMICVEDALDAVNWIEDIGGLDAAREKCDENLLTLTKWVEESEWADFLVQNKRNRSNTSVCLKIIDPWFLALHDEQQTKIPKLISELLEIEGVAFDINGYRDAPPGLRIWTGATVQNQDINYLLPWLDWAYNNIKSDFIN